MKKQCVAPSCAAKGIKVETKAEKCLLCGAALESPYKFLFDGLDDIGGGLFGKH